LISREPFFSSGAALRIGWAWVKAQNPHLVTPISTGEKIFHKHGCLFADSRTVLPVRHIARVAKRKDIGKEFVLQCELINLNPARLVSQRARFDEVRSAMLKCFKARRRRDATVIRTEPPRMMGIL
jgi:hypothetical protein